MLKEQITYMGDIRLIGLIMDPRSITNTIGYLVYVEKQNKVQVVSKPILFQLAKRYKFSNIEITNNNIECTECALDRFPRYLSDGNKITKCLDTNKIYIIGEIIRNDIVAGYRVIASNGNIADLQSDDIIKAFDKNFEIVNAHLRDGKTITANKEKKFMTIRQESVKQTDHKTLNNYGHKTSDEYKKAYLRRLAKFAMNSGKNIPLPRGSYGPDYDHRAIDKPNIRLSIGKFVHIVKTELYPLAESNEKEFVLEYINDILNNINDLHNPVIVAKAKVVCGLALKLFESGNGFNAKLYPRTYYRCLSSLRVIINTLLVQHVSSIKLTSILNEYLTKYMEYNNINQELEFRLRCNELLDKGLALDHVGNELRIVKYTEATIDYRRVDHYIDRNGDAVVAIMKKDIAGYDKLNELLYSKYRITLESIGKRLNRAPKIAIGNIGMGYFMHNALKTKAQHGANYIDLNKYKDCIININVQPDTRAIRSEQFTAISDGKVIGGKNIWKRWLYNYMKDMLEVTGQKVKSYEYIYNKDIKIRIMIALMALFDYDTMESTVKTLNNAVIKNDLLDVNAFNKQSIKTLNESVPSRDYIDSIVKQEDLHYLKHFYENPCCIYIDDHTFVHLSTDVHRFMYSDANPIETIRLAQINDPRLINNKYNEAIETIITQLILITGLTELQIATSITGIPLY